VLATDGFAIDKTRDFATLLFGSPKAAKDGVKTLVVYAASEADPLGARIERVGANLTKVGVTHTGALDVKDVLGYPRMILTTAAYETLTAAFEDKAKKESA